MRIAILGTGGVAQTLGAALVRAGHDVVFGSRDPAHRTGLPAPVQRSAQAVVGADVVLNAVQGVDTLSLLEAIGADNLDGDRALGHRQRLHPRLAQERAEGAQGFLRSVEQVLVAQEIDRLRHALLLGERFGLLHGPEPAGVERVARAEHARPRRNRDVASIAHEPHEARCRVAVERALDVVHHERALVPPAPLAARRARRVVDRSHHPERVARPRRIRDRLDVEWHVPRVDVRAHELDDVLDEQAELPPIAEIAVALLDRREEVEDVRRVRHDDRGVRVEHQPEEVRPRALGPDDVDRIARRHSEIVIGFCFSPR